MDRWIDGWVSRATRLARYTVPRSTYLSIYLSINQSIYLSSYLSIQVLAHLCTAVKGQVAFLCGGAAG